MYVIVKFKIILVCVKMRVKLTLVEYVYVIPLIIGKVKLVHALVKTNL